MTVGEPDEQVFTNPPLICVEILTSEDRIADLQERVEDSLAFGVQYVWVLNPYLRKAWRCAPAAGGKLPELRTEKPALVVPVADLFG